MLQDIKNLDDIYELLKGNICDDPENYPGYILVKNDYDVCFRIFIYKELLHLTLTFYIDNSENPDNLIIYLRGLNVALNNHHENNSKEFVLAYNSDNNTYYDENNVYNIYDSRKNILDEIIRHYKIIKKNVPVESTRIETGVYNVSYIIEHTLSQDYSEYGDNKYTDDGIQASNKYKDENLNLSTYSSISDFQNYINNKNNTAAQRFVNDLENTTIDEEFKQIIDEIFANYNIDKELYIRFSPHDEIEGVRETQVKLAIEKDGKIPQYEDDTEYYDSIVAKEKTPLFNRNLIYQNNKIDYIENKLKNDYSQNYFTMVVTTSGNVTWTGTLNDNKLSYSKDNGTTWSTPSSDITLSVNKGDKVLWKGVTTSTGAGIGKFSGDDNVRYSVEGNTMSLLFGDNFKGQTSLEGKDYAFSHLFDSNINITSTENLSLPATTLAESCYEYMFSECTNLTTVPELPATTLATQCYSNMFKGCTNLTTAPELPATTLASNCYNGMFNGCTNLTTAPQLPATTLAESCYEYMFYDCTNLTTAPELPATTLAEYCYTGMFSGCTRLTTAPELPATTLASSCYSGVFRGCTNLTTAPQLPATTLAEYCYNGMFSGCTSLTTAPELPATTLTKFCYSYMFNGCTSLTTAPQLLATTLATYCYQGMFNGCTNLNSIKCLATNISATNCTKGWVNGVAASGTFIKAESMRNWTTGVNGIPSGWTVEHPDNYFTFNITTGGNITWTGTSTNALSYSTNNGITWSDPSVNITLSVVTGNKVRWKGITSPDSGIGTFSGDTNVRYSVEGNVMSLLYGDDFKGQTSLEGKNAALYELFNYNENIISSENLSLPATILANQCYSYMFAYCTNLTTAPKLSAATLVQECYYSMFEGCTSLMTAPELPATTLGDNCYENMFYGCTNLITPPSVLPATTLTGGCYASMFAGCTSLMTAPELPATTLAESSYNSMFADCTNLTTPPELSATTLVDDCYDRMFYGCTSLTTAPELPATTLTKWCYEQMFYGCTNLNSIKCLATDISASNCTTDWVTGVPPYEAEIEYLELTGTQWIDTGVYGDLETETEITFSLHQNSITDGCCVFGTRTSATVRNFSVMEGNGDASLNIDCGDYRNSRCSYHLMQKDVIYTVHIDKNIRSVKENNSIIARNATVLSTPFTTERTLKIGYTDQTGNWWQLYYNMKGRVYSCYIKKNNTLVRDLIPVRVGNVGYMYDKVSGQLFGNSGTGNFVLGNDVKVNTFIKDSSMGDWTTGANGIPSGWTVESI